MSWILGPGCAPLLRRYQRNSALLVFDYHGTLAPNGDDRSLQDMRQCTTERLRALAAQKPVAILSGASRSDVVCRLDRIPVVEVIRHSKGKTFCRHDGTDRSVKEEWQNEPAERAERAERLAGTASENRNPSVAVRQHAAIARLYERLGHPPTLYVGSQDSNVGAFGNLFVKDMLFVRIGAIGKKRCYFLHDQREIDALLLRLLAEDPSFASPCLRQGP